MAHSLISGDIVYHNCKVQELKIEDGLAYSPNISLTLVILDACVNDIGGEMLEGVILNSCC